ncbi:Tpr-related protein family member, putative [Theileria annulata]|uniref:Tpr-related protein family member, putative n=1 Tax=Theileria annulata TaxID=5874 RepID=Q4UIY5_THEAN|nr:Tpr-related protein family member, putative [Theileria annulata]CAI72954.1 Tpr-related protein family member, putative [Theileria annulata]|eukprot:XP_953632.1 Tpr-related protein family member, putative [Theileria annulata]
MGDQPEDPKKDLKISAYILAGLAMMLNIRLSYSSAPYALIRFQLPENLFSVFVRRMASALELWCLPSMLLGNLMDIIRKHAFTDNKKKEAWGYHWQSIFWSWANFLTFVILLFVYRGGGEHGRLTMFYWIIAISGFVFGINMVMVYALEAKYLTWYMIGENSFPAVTSLMHYITTLIFGNRRKWNSDYVIVYIDIWVAIIISLVAAAVWTGAYSSNYDGGADFGATPNQNLISPVAMVIVGMGLVYAIYPGIAPGMIVPFYLIDKIEMVLLIATAVPPIIIGILRATDTKGFPGGPQTPTCKWYNDTTDGNGSFWHAFDLLIVLKISLAGIFIYSLHYRDSSLARSIVNQPKMSTALSILFYMCHEILLAIGFPGIFGGNSGGDQVMLPAQYVGALFMIFLAFYSEGYIIEYKSHDPAHWPTDGMTPWNALCYWAKRASKITNHNLESLFTTNLHRYLNFKSLHYVLIHIIHFKI